MNIKPNKLKELYESKFANLTATECLELCTASLKYPLDNIKPKDPVLKYVMESAKVVKLLDRPEKYKDDSAYRKDVLKELTESVKFDYYEIDRGITPQLKTRLHDELCFLRENKYGLSNESVIMGCSPIVPYQGTISPMRAESDQSIYVRKLMSHIINRDKKVRTLKDIISNNTFDFLSRLPMDLMSNTSMESFITVINSRSIDSEAAEAIIDALDIKCQPEALATLESIINGDTKLDSDMFTKIGSMINTEDEELLNAMEAFGEAHNQSFNNLLTNAGMIERNTGDMFANYDMQLLLDYVAKNTHYSLSDYANSEFLSSKRNISDMFNYGDFLIAEVDSEFLVTPVMDVSNGNSPMLVCVDREGMIIISKI